MVIVKICFRRVPLLTPRTAPARGNRVGQRLHQPVPRGAVYVLGGAFNRETCGRWRGQPPCGMFTPVDGVHMRAGYLARILKKRSEPIAVKFHVRAMVDGRMLRVAADVKAAKGDNLRDLLKRLRRDGTVSGSLVRQILSGDPGVMVLRNGQRLALPSGAEEPLADGDEISALTPMAGG